MKNLSVYLTYAGAIPFMVCAICLGLNQQTLLGLGSVETILSVYALIIATFLAGSHWGLHLSVEGKWHTSLALLSNITAVVLWLCFLTFSFQELMIAFIVAFTALLFVDYRLFKSQLISFHYFRTRCFITIIVVSTLIISKAFA